MHLHLVESAIKVGLSSGKLTVKNAEDGSLVRELPFNDLDGISVFGKAQLSTSLLRGCIEKSIPVLFYSEDGHYFGHLSSSEQINPERQRQQVYMSDNPQFCLGWSKNIVSAKINNSLALLKSNEDIYEFNDSDLQGLFHSLKYVEQAESVSQVLGFEGNAAKNYFDCLSKLLRNEEFAFQGRSTRPPKDPFNSMLSYGYSVLYRNIIGAIEEAGLNPYFAFMHTIKQGHAALASDLVEEWRALLVDRTALGLVNEGRVDVTDFYENDVGAIYMKQPTMKLLTRCLGDAMLRDELYFLEDGDRKHYGFQVALRKKVQILIEAIDKGDPNIYRPVLWSDEMGLQSDRT